ncbi:hypothetical protein AGLY_002443 [Aphis glycines]|uniref:Uncharacterized protein n=1 Tax=Aphis glycines TaxID=307491 RepID=A0A6G0U2L5_APHGL|nr:hypothetical protein AGLY_002443 [Aphis glycines]
MPICEFFGCDNGSKRKSLVKNHKIMLHRFPKDPILRDNFIHGMIDGIMCLEEFITPQKNRSSCNEPRTIRIFQLSLNVNNYNDPWLLAFGWFEFILSPKFLFLFFGGFSPFGGLPPNKSLLPLVTPTALLAIVVGCTLILAPFRLFGIQLPAVCKEFSLRTCVFPLEFGDYYPTTNAKLLVKRKMYKAEFYFWAILGLLHLFLLHFDQLQFLKINTEWSTDKTKVNGDKLVQSIKFKSNRVGAVIWKVEREAKVLANQIAQIDIYHIFNCFISEQALT